MKETDHIQRVLLCQDCGTGRYAYTQNSLEHCTYCGQSTADTCPNCNLPLKDPDGRFCYSCGHQLYDQKLPDKTQLLDILKQLEGYIQHSILAPSTENNQVSAISSIELQPGHLDNHQHKNRVILNPGVNEHTKYLSNSCFDLLYYLAWLQEEGLPGLIIYQAVPDQHKSLIYSDYNRRTRFGAKWTEADSRARSDYIWRVNQEIGFRLISKTKSHIILNSFYHIKLLPYHSD